MFCNDFVSVSLIVKKKAKTVKQSGCGLASVLKKMGISNIISDDIFRWKQKWSTGMKAWKEKRKIIYIYNRNYIAFTVCLFCIELFQRD